MFRNTFQGGSVVDLFSPVNKDLKSNWIVSKHVTVQYCKTAKTMVCFLKGKSTLEQLSIPKEKTKTLGLLQSYLVVQVYCSEDQRFSLDIRLTCKSGCHRRISFLSHKQQTHLTPLFSAIPLNVPTKGKWLHLVINFADVVAELWKEEYQSIDSLSICGECNLRKIYTMRKDLVETPDCRSWQDKYMESLPKQCHFPIGVPQSFHLIGKTYISCCLKSSLQKKTSNSSVSSNSSAKGSFCPSRSGSVTQQASLKGSFKQPAVRSNQPQIKTIRPLKGRSILTSLRKPQTPTRVTITSAPMDHTRLSSHQPDRDSVDSFVNITSRSDESSDSDSDLPVNHKNLSPEESQTPVNSYELYFSEPPSADVPAAPTASNANLPLADLLPRYERHKINISQLSPVSNALSLARSVSSQHSLASNLSDTLQDNVGDLWVEYVDKKQSAANNSDFITLLRKQFHENLSVSDDQSDSELGEV